MEKHSDPETQDFMTVDSFSQLPFMRPAQVRHKGIRLFGIEFTSSSAKDAEPADTEGNANVSQDAKDTADETERRFECHYCYRNFPTSQALGGHQNAHKRERQSAKRAQLQSALAHNSIVHHHHHHHSRHVVYGLASRHQLQPARPYAWTNGHVSSSEPINGNPLPGLWRIPSTDGLILHRDRSSTVNPMHLLEVDRHVYGRATAINVHDHVSLDLRL